MTFYFRHTPGFAKAATTDGLRAALKKLLPGGRLAGAWVVSSQPSSNTAAEDPELAVSMQGPDSAWSPYLVQPLDSTKGATLYRVPLSILAAKTTAVAIL